MRPNLRKQLPSRIYRTRQRAAQRLSKLESLGLEGRIEFTDAGFLVAPRAPDKQTRENDSAPASA